MFGVSTRSLAALLLAFVLGWTSVGMATSRAQAQVGTIVTLCTPGGAVLVSLGADGQPQPQSHPCPYCVIMAGAALPVPFAVPVALRGAPLPVSTATAAWQAACGPAAAPPEARAPPSFLSL